MFFGRVYRFFVLACVAIWLSYSKIDAVAFSRFFEFDLAGNLKKVLSADNCYIDYEYDQMNQLIKVTDSQGKVFRYQYDVSGNCIQAEDENGIVDYEYDLLNHLTSVTYSGIAPIRYSYDLRGRLQQIIYPGGIRVSYSYDAADRLLSVEYPHGKTQYVYDQESNTLSKMVLPTGITTEYRYDQAKRITSVFHRRFDKTLIMGFQYIFDGNGNRIHMEEIDENGSRGVDFSYDKLNRLVSVNYPEGYEKYTYDNLGNRLTKETPSILIKYEYDKNNQLIKTDDTQFFYDARGNLVKKVRFDKTMEYTYDIHDNLIAYQDEEYDIRYTYDSEGRRTSKSINGEKTFYINDARSPVTQVLIEAAEKKRTKIFYIYGLSRLNQTSSKGSHSYLYDYPDRNVIALVNEKQHLCNRYDYEVFGLPKNSHSAIPNHFTYTGEDYEKETGLIFLRNRYYDPEIGRFISADPSLGKLTNPQSFNPYTYAGNNPGNFIDPLGLRSARVCVYPAGTVTKEGKSLTGHGFWVLTKDSGEVLTVGRYPGRPQYDDEMTPNTFFYEWPATDKQIQAIVNATEKGPYLGVIGNCIDGLERGLQVLGVEHPSFSLMGVSMPTKAIIWLESLMGKDDFKRAMQQDLKFIADPDSFSPAVRFSPNVVKPTCPYSAISGDLGGVSFDQTAQLIGTLTDVLGATYDSSTGQLILIGSQNYSLPPMDFDDLAVAVRSVYGLGGKPPQDPGVSIDWNTERDRIQMEECWVH
ncbi:MAG: RHS repeat-associated core domain-containing protein [Candidatus Rhabdochlamydia sp.]